MQLHSTLNAEHYDRVLACVPAGIIMRLQATPRRRSLRRRRQNAFYIHTPRLLRRYDIQIIQLTQCPRLLERIAKRRERG